MTSNFDATFSCIHHKHNKPGAGHMEPPISAPGRADHADDHDLIHSKMDGLTRNNQRHETAVVGRLRTHPELRLTQSMLPEQKALLAIVAIREHYICGQPEKQDMDFNDTGDHITWLDKLHDLACWALLTREYDYDVEIVRMWRSEAVYDGGVHFVRWVTDHILEFMTSDRVAKYVWGSYVVMQLSDIMDEIQQMTVEIDNIISRNGQKEVETTRVNAMLTLLEDLFGFTQETLQKTGKSHIGIQELLSIARETDIIRTQKDFNLCMTYADMEHVQGVEHPVCFQVISGHVIYRLKMTNHSLPVENAVSIMLKVIPQLDEYTLNKIPLEDWCATLRRYGFAASADKLVAAVNGEDLLESDAATPVNVGLYPSRTPAAVLPQDHRPPPVFGYRTSIEIDGDNNNDDKNDHLSTPGSQDWVDIKLTPSPYPPVDPSPQDQQTPRQLFLQGHTQASEDVDGSKVPGPTYDRSDRSTLRTPSLASDDSDISDSAFQSTPRPVKRVTMSDDAADSTEFDLILESPPRPMKRARMDMDALRGALANAQGERGSHSSSQASSPIIEMGDPHMHNLPDGSGDGNDFEPSTAPQNDDNTAMEIDEVEMEGLEEPVEGKEASKEDGDAVIGNLNDVQNSHEIISGSKVPAVNVAGSEHLTQSSPSGNDHVVEVVPAARDDENAATNIEENNDRKKVEDSGEQVGVEQANKENNDTEGVDTAGAAGVDEAGEDAVEEDNDAQEPGYDGDIDGDDQSSSSDDQADKADEPNPRKWRDAYKEYKSWPRDLKIYGKVDLILQNGLRRDLLKCLSQSEVTGVECWWEHRPKDRKRGTRNVEFDLESIREAVESAMKQRRRKGKFRTLAEVIDHEGDVKYDPITKAFLPADAVDGLSEEEEDPIEWRDMYAEYKAFPRQLKVYDYVWLRLFNAERKSALKALSRAEARGKRCYIDELDEEERNDLYENIENDMEAIRTVVRDAAKRRYHSGPYDSLAKLIDWSEDEIEYDDGEVVSFNPEDEDSEDEDPDDEDGDSMMAD